MDLQKIALIGTFISYLWFIPVLYIFNKPIAWKIRKIKIFSFLPVLGAYLFVIGISAELFFQKDYISYGFNKFNFLIIVFLILQSIMTLIIEFLQNMNGQYELNDSKKREVTLNLILTLLFTFDLLIRYEIYKMTF